MNVKSTFPTRNAQVSRLWWINNVVCRSSVLPKLPVYVNPSLNRPAIRRVPDKLLSWMWAGMSGSPQLLMCSLARRCGGVMSMSPIFRGTVAIVSVVFFPMLAVAEGAKSPGIITSINRSATISTGGMPPGSEMWALWVSLPAGKKVEVKEPKVPSTWMDLEVDLTGSTVTASGTAPEEGCVLFGADGQKNFTAQESTTRPGDALACNFTTGVPYWQENRGDELYSRAQLNIGGPWAQGMYDTPSAYRMAGGDSQALRVDAILFREVEKELRATGMMTATTRIVTMPPGSKSMATDRYPTLRMVTSGELRWGTIPIELETSAMPKSMFKLGQFNWIQWTRPQQVVLSNESDKPAELVEWSVTPALGTAP
jgi:hypothetical protein